MADWDEAFLSLRETLGLPPDTPAPKIPRPEHSASVPSTTAGQPPSSKRKAASGDEEVEMDPGGEENKRSRTDIVTKAGSAAPEPSDTSRIHAQAAAAYIPFLDVEDLLPPKLPSHEEMEGVLLALRKKALVEEYFGDTT